jgi:NADH dehydrogenase FAD-containing subunit
MRPGLQEVDKRRYDVTLISPVGHFNFTPLLAGAAGESSGVVRWVARCIADIKAPHSAVGTLEFRCAVEGVRKYAKQITYHEAWADDIDFDKKQILCVRTI